VVPKADLVQDKKARKLVKKRVCVVMIISHY